MEVDFVFDESTFSDVYEPLDINPTTTTSNSTTTPEPSTTTTTSQEATPDLLTIMNTKVKINNETYCNIINTIQVHPIFVILDLESAGLCITEIGAIELFSKKAFNSMVNPYFKRLKKSWINFNYKGNDIKSEDLTGYPTWETIGNVFFNWLLSLGTSNQIIYLVGFNIKSYDFRMLFLNCKLCGIEIPKNIKFIEIYQSSEQTKEKLIYNGNKRNVINHGVHHALNECIFLLETIQALAKERNLDILEYILRSKNSMNEKQKNRFLHTEKLKFVFNDVTYVLLD